MSTTQRIATLVLLAAISLAAAASAQAAEEPRVEISGGVDPSGQNYAWTVKNLSDTPIVSVTFPHYNADLFSPPTGWLREETHLRHVATKPAPGIARAYVNESEHSGILPGASADFTMRINADGASKARGAVDIQFKDGGTLKVRNVELPTAPTFFGQHGTTIALAAAFGVFLLFQVLRRRKRAPDVTDQESDDETSGSVA